MILTPVWGWVAARNKYTKEVLDTGWTPVVSAMLISRLVDTCCICDVDQQVNVAPLQLHVNESKQPSVPTSRFHFFHFNLGLMGKHNMTA
jgi:hypothetical protein